MGAHKGSRTRSGAGLARMGQDGPYGLLAHMAKRAQRALGPVQKGSNFNGVHGDHETGIGQGLPKGLRPSKRAKIPLF